MTTFTNVNATVSQQFTSFTTGHHTSCVPSVISTITTCSASSVTQLSQGVLIYEQCSYPIHMYI